MTARKKSAEETVLLIGTVKRIFLWEMGARGPAGKLSGPQLAGTGHFEHGPTIRISEDGGTTWCGVKRDPKFASGTKAELKHIWQIVRGHPSEPGTWYAGVDDAALFVSRDDGESWAKLPASFPRITSVKVWSL